MPLPIVTISAGDPVGIGPEVIVKALVTGQPYEHCKPVIVGSLELIAQTLQACGTDWQVKPISHPGEADSDKGRINVIDVGGLDMDKVRSGAASIEAGRVNGIWLEVASQLVREGSAGATVMGPVFVARSTVA